MLHLNQHMSTLYTFGVEVKFTRIWEDFGGVSDCEELVELDQETKY